MSSPGPGTVGDIKEIESVGHGKLQQERVEALNSWETASAVEEGGGEGLG